MELTSLKGSLAATERGPRKMLSLETRQLISRLHQEGKGILELSRLFKVTRSSVRRCIRNNYRTERKVSPARSSLNTHREEIKQMYFEYEGFCVPLQRTIKEQFNESVSLRMLECFVKVLRRLCEGQSR